MLSGVSKGKAQVRELRKAGVKRKWSAGIVLGAGFLFFLFVFLLSVPCRLSCCRRCFFPCGFHFLYCKVFSCVVSSYYLLYFLCVIFVVVNYVLLRCHTFIYNMVVQFVGNALYLMLYNVMYNIEGVCKKV